MMGFLLGVILGRNLVPSCWERAVQVLAGVVGMALPISCVMWATMQWPPRTVINPKPFCWAAMVSHTQVFGDGAWHCVECSDKACIDQYSGGHIRVHLRACDDQDRWHTPSAAPV